MNTCKKILKNEKLLVCAILVQFLLGCTRLLYWSNTETNPMELSWETVYMECLYK